MTGANIIGYHSADGSYKVNPTPDTHLEPGESFILLGNKRQLAALQEFLENYKEEE